MTSDHWGATHEDWATFDLVLGLTEDLLPVVSNPGARISPKSTMKALGKTPSLYNGDGGAVGIKGWADKLATPAEVERWSQVADYGICLQTRRIRALDIDVADEALSTTIVNFVKEYLGIVLPRRYRQGSGKCLLAFDLPGAFDKGVMKVQGGMVEFLAQGQQFIASGHHVSGTRYEWAGGVPLDIPMVSAEQFEALWAAMAERFAVEPPTRVRRVARGDDLGLDDEVAGWLVDNWETFGLDREGRRLFVACPWKEGHTADSGETESAWLMRGTGGMAQGHFKCLHASCAGRTDGEFLSAVGYVASGFDVIESPKGTNEKALAAPLPAFERKLKRGVEVPEGTLMNVYLAVRREDVIGCRIALDSFRSELMIAPEGSNAWEPVDDDDITELRLHLHAKHNFLTIPHDTMRQVVSQVGKENTFDHAQDWLRGLPLWDGVERVGRFMADYMGCADTQYASAVGVYMWSAHAGRVMDPGCKADMAPILVGGQGIGKSRGVAAISPSPDFFVEIGFQEKDDDLSRKMRGTLVAEIAELRGLNSKDAQTIKAQMSRQFEKWTPKFKEFKTAFPRRLMFWGTSNEDEVLADSTGERRWLPIHVEREVNVDSIIRDRDQLWAEGLVKWRVEGVGWRDAQRLGASAHGKFKVTDPWEDRIAAWLDDGDLTGKTPRGGDGFSMEEVVTSVLGLDFARFGKREEMRIGKILRGQGLQRVLRRADGKTRRVWVST